MTPLRQFDQQYIDKDCTQCRGTFSNCLFYNCTFDKLVGLTLRNCDLNKSKFLTNTIEKAFNFTLTLNCHSFVGVTYSEFLFDMMLYLLSRTSGNDAKREQLTSMLGPTKVHELDLQLRSLE